MDRTLHLIVPVAAGAWLCWYPLIMLQGFSPPFWLPLPLIALLIAVSTILSPDEASGMIAAAVVGTCVGIWSGYIIWKPSDSIVGSYIGLTIVVGTLATLVVSLITSFLSRKVAARFDGRARSLWVLLVCCVAVGPLALAVAPTIVAHRVARNDRIAALRFESLKRAVEKAISEDVSQSSVCNGRRLQRYYLGPSFSDDDWASMASRYISDDGYIFMVHCRQLGGFAIDARPKRGKIDGTRQFCADESGEIGCELGWSRSRYKCLPCPQ